MYSMSGDVVELPVGGVIRKKNSAVTQQAEMQRLGQLADILGMSPVEVRAVQQDLAGQAFKQQVRGWSGVWVLCEHVPSRIGGHTGTHTHTSHAAMPLPQLSIPTTTGSQSPDP
jgi:hypothetical protein